MKLKKTRALLCLPRALPQRGETKLRELGVQKNTKDIIITKLIETDYLNETRFAKSFVRESLDKKLG